MPVPFAAGGFQLAVGGSGAGPAGAAHRQLHGQDGNAHTDQAEQIEQDKNAAAVGTGDGGKAPDIADADGAPGTDQQKAKPGFEVFSFHTKRSFFPYSRRDGTEMPAPTRRRRFRVSAKAKSGGRQFCQLPPAQILL